MTGRLSYREVHNVVAHLPIVLRNVRTRREIGYRTAAEEIGISHSSLWRFEQGHDQTAVGTVLLILAWLDTQHTATASAAVTSTLDAPAGPDDVDVPGQHRPTHAHPGHTEGHTHPGGVKPHHHVWLEDGRTRDGLDRMDGGW